MGSLSNRPLLNTAVLIVAAGRGVRAGAGLPKQYRTLAGRPMLRRTLLPFLAHERIDSVRVIIRSGHESLYRNATAGLDLFSPVTGGDSRQESCLKGLESLRAAKPVRVLIHDAARPFVDPATIDSVLDALDKAPGAIPALPVSDSLKQVTSDGRVDHSVGRANLWRAQTPQGFHFDAILDAHQRFGSAAHVDDAAVAEAAGLAIAVVPGSEDNFKVTSEDDVRRADRILGSSDIRVGSGFDVHRFTAGDHVMLCGVRVDHDQSLAGHSDADVGLHALTDALLGAIGAGDIGQHYPPSDKNWQNADSAQFLAHSAALVSSRGGEIRHLDVTLICERPKLAAHRDAMVARVADIVDIDPGRVSVKATTTEGLGLTGHGEGIAAQATATIAVQERL